MPASPNDDDYAKDIFESSAAFMMLMQNTDRYRKQLAARSGLNVVDLQALRRISDGQVVTPKDLGESLELTTGAVTALIDRLETAGFVARRPHPTDRRSITLELTVEGAEKMVAVYADFQNVFLEALRNVSRDDIRAATQLMTRVDAVIRTQR